MQAQYFVNLEVQMSERTWQDVAGAALCDLEVQISWQGQRLVNAECSPILNIFSFGDARRSITFRLFTGGFVPRKAEGHTSSCRYAGRVGPDIDRQVGSRTGGGCFFLGGGGSSG